MPTHMKLRTREFVEHAKALGFVAEVKAAEGGENHVAQHLSYQHVMHTVTSQSMYVLSTNYQQGQHANTHINFHTIVICCKNCHGRIR